MQLFEIKDNFQQYNHIRSKLLYGDIGIKEPIYSILIPTYKRSVFLKEAIDSAIYQLDSPIYEIIIVDNDPSENNIIELVKSYKINHLLYYKNEENIGMIGNWNRCIELARGKWLTFLHDDDLLAPNYLKKMSMVLYANPTISLLAPSAYIGKDSKVFKNKLDSNKNSIFKLTLESMFYDNLVPTQATMLLKKNCLKLGGFNRDYFPSSDYVFWINWIKHFQGYKLNEVLLFYRVSENESRKRETIVNILKTNYNIRKELSNNISHPKFITNSYNKIFLFHQIDISNQHNKTGLNRKEISTIFNINKFWDSYVIKKICIRITLLLLKLSRKWNQERLPNFKI